ncbi:MAG: DUF4230 domain-containing protein [Anaerolineae bacterium]|nr:DUF4230 domain-containing protein [Anaerolineae bacterium]
MTNQVPDSLPEQLPSPPAPQTAITETNVESGTGRRGCSGCAWLLAGGLGCLALLLIPIVILMLAGTITINGLISNVRDIFNPPVVITASVVLERIQGMSQLTSVRYNYSSVVTSEREMPELLQLLYGNKQVMIAVGHVNAGIDLSQLTALNIAIDGSTLIVQLPAPALQDCFLNDQESYIMSQETGIFAEELPNLTTDARRYALEQFRDNAIAEGILNEANLRAQTIISDLLKATEGDRVVQVLITQPDPNTPLPETCEG